MSENIEIETNEEELDENTETEEKSEPKNIKKRFSSLHPKHKVALLTILICLVGGLGYYIYSALNWPAEKICRTLINQVSTLELVTIGENENISYFKDSVIKEDVPYTGMIEVFENKSEALLKKEYYEYYDAEMMKVFNEETLGSELYKTYPTGKWKMYVNGNTLIRYSYLYSEYQINLLNKQFNIVMDKTYQTEKNVPTKEQQDLIQKNYKKQADDEVKLEKETFVSSLEATLITLKAEAELEETTIDRLLEIKEDAELYKALAELGTKALEVQTIVDNRINSQIEHVDNLLDEAINTYSRDKVQEAKDAIALLTHDIFKEHKDPWNKRIDQILYQIKEKEIQDYKDQCVAYNYYDIDESYAGKQAYFYGKIMSVSTNTNGHIALVVNITPQYLFGSIAYWSNSVYVEMDDDITLDYGQGDLIELWGEIDGVVVNEQIFGDDKVYPSFYCKYAS